MDSVKVTFWLASTLGVLALGFASGMVLCLACCVTSCDDGPRFACPDQVHGCEPLDDGGDSDGEAGP
jgi:hypothetical protein